MMKGKGIKEDEVSFREITKLRNHGICNKLGGKCMQRKDDGQNVVELNAYEIFNFIQQKTPNHSYTTLLRYKYITRDMTNIDFCILTPFFFFFLLFFFCLFRAASTVYGSSQARGPIGAVVPSLHHSLSNMGSKPCLRPTPQLTITPDP